MKKYYRLIRAKYNYWFGENAIPVWVLPVLIPIGTLAALVSGLGAVLFYLGALIVVPIDGILGAFSWIIEKTFMRGEK